MGFEMHNMAPDEERSDQLGPDLPSWISHSSFFARRKQRDIKRAATAPRTAPGKNPAAIAPGGKEGHEIDGSAIVEFADFSDEGDGTGVMVALGVDELVAVVDNDALVEELDADDVAVVDDVAVLVDEMDTTADAVVEVFRSRKQVLPPSQV
jgi:hypothetical protein